MTSKEQSTKSEPAKVRRLPSAIEKLRALNPEQKVQLYYGKQLKLVTAAQAIEEIEKRNLLAKRNKAKAAKKKVTKK